LWISLARKQESAEIAIHLRKFCGFCCRLPNARARSITSTGETNCANTALIMRHGGCNICRSLCGASRRVRRLSLSFGAIEMEMKMEMAMQLALV